MRDGSRARLVRILPKHNETAPKRRETNNISPVGRTASSATSGPCTLETATVRFSAMTGELFISISES